jgi:hypothetical protein
MSKITVTSEVMCDGITRRVIIDVYDTGCRIISPMYNVTLTWDQMVDVELLADTFEYEIVKVFRLIVTELGKIYDRKDVYKELA